MDKVIPGQVTEKVAQLMADIKAGKIKPPEYHITNESDNLDPQKVIHGSRDSISSFFVTLNWSTGSTRNRHALSAE